MLWPSKASMLPGGGICSYMHESLRNHPLPRDSRPTRAGSQSLAGAPTAETHSYSHRTPATKALFQDQRANDWADSERLIAETFGAVYPQELGTVLRGLHLSGLTPLRLLKDVGKGRVAVVEVGEPAPDLTIGYEQQRPILAESLRKRWLPLAVRVAHLREIGFAPLSDEVIQTIGVDRMRHAYPALLTSLSEVYAESLRKVQHTQPRSETIEEGSRLRRNSALHERLRIIISEFENSPYSRPGITVLMHGDSGSPLRLSVGEVPNLTIHRGAAGISPLRSLYEAEQRSMLARFGDFLKQRYLQGH
ncbi:MAG: hypothetical protein EBZ48_15540 [Proteobacteria bacterium]|nr:hypothetical protein [Pseudomonadota bacterium]